MRLPDEDRHSYLVTVYPRRLSMRLVPSLEKCLYMTLEGGFLESCRSEVSATCRERGRDGQRVSWRWKVPIPTCPARSRQVRPTKVPPLHRIVAGVGGGWAGDRTNVPVTIQ